MSTINNVFIDSSVLIEYFKDSKTELLEYLTSSPEFNLYINDIVLSEVIYHLIAYVSKSSPLTLKRKNRLMAEIETIDFNILFKNFNHINARVENVTDITNLMAEFNLLSNDALILNCTLEHEIKLLASFDSDFEFPSNQFGISLISTVEQLKNIKS